MTMDDFQIDRIRQDLMVTLKSAVRWSKKTHTSRGWTAADICTNCVYTIPVPEMGARFRFLASRRLLPAAWLALLLTKAGDVESNPGPATHTNKHTPVIWIFDLCHKQINKKQTSIKCNHTHNTHWVHLKCTHIQQRQYKPDWSCTIHTPTQNVTTTPSTDNTTPHHKQTTTHPRTNNNQPKDKNIVILQITINSIRNIIEQLKNLVHSTQPDIITIQETKLTQKAKTPTIPPLHHHTHRQRAQTRRGGAHHTDQGRHNFHKHKHTQGHQHTQHRITTDQNTLQQATSPDITTISTTLYNRPTWHTIHALNSDHLPIITTINTRTKYKLQQNRHTFTNYRKANWTQFTTDTEAAFSDILPPPDIHTANT